MDERVSLEFFSALELDGIHYYSIGFCLAAFFVLIIFQCVLYGLTPCNFICCSPLLGGFFRILSLSTDFVENYADEIPSLGAVTSRNPRMKELIKRKNTASGAAVLIIFFILIVSFYFSITAELASTRTCAQVQTLGSLDLYELSFGLDVEVTIYVNTDDGFLDKDAARTLIDAWNVGTNVSTISVDSVAINFVADSHWLLYSADPLTLPLSALHIETIDHVKLQSRYRDYSSGFPFYGNTETTDEIGRRDLMMISQSDVEIRSDFANISMTIPTAITQVVRDAWDMRTDFRPDVEGLKFMRPDRVPLFDVNRSTPLLADATDAFTLAFAPYEIGSEAVLLECEGTIEIIIGILEKGAIYLALYPVVKIILEALARGYQWLVPTLIIGVAVSSCLIPVPLIFALSSVGFYYAHAHYPLTSQLLYDIAACGSIIMMIAGFQSIICTVFYLIKFGRMGGWSLIKEAMSRLKTKRLRNRERSKHRQAVKQRSLGEGSARPNPLTGPMASSSTLTDSSDAV
ncbi:hypothetical protein J8273_1864 [Carpediemonas membranifera]|uniref:Transmembrane protein n=1 Tax=Carpediemonas membranifera TaxID=201153 RepID=A0A8J6E4E0_9EUKA|nr:hypothetical protein J8273_1864 [Carpediemonas membranifera]|eukprot:KAG9396821.1 hypothetical protein J8273_1864 [Carpediemonas membranifera]